MDNNIIEQSDMMIAGLNGQCLKDRDLLMCKRIMVDEWTMPYNWECKPRQKTI